VKKNRLRLGLDILLTVAFLLLMDPRSFYGLVFHEWAGLIICVFFIVHILLDWMFVKAVTLRFFRKLPVRTRINYVLDLVLLLVMSMIIWSGLPIARVIDFSWLGFDRGGERFWRLMHTSMSMVGLLVIGMHLGLHWNWVIARLRRAPRTA
jgi:predicted ferric reductase